MKSIKVFIASVLCGLVLSFYIALFSVACALAVGRAGQYLKAQQPSGTKFSTTQPWATRSISPDPSQSQTPQPPVLTRTAPTLSGSSATTPVVRYSLSGTITRIYSGRSAARRCPTSLLPVFIRPRATKVPEQWTTSTRKRKKARRRSTPLYR